MPTLAETIVSFDTFLRVERNLSPRTRAAYLYDLGRFEEFIRQRKGGRTPKPADVDVLDIKEYLAFLQGELSYRPATMSRNISSIRVFFDFCVEQGVLEASPSTSIHNPKMAQRLPVFLIDGEVKSLFEAPDRSLPLGRRDYAMLVTFSFTGLRLQELVGLDTLDIDFERKTVKVLGKGRKERLVPMNASVETALREWLEMRQPAEGEKAVFINRFGRRITGRGIEQIVHGYVLRAGISKTKVSPHKLRHTFATLLHMRDVDLVEIQSLMGHASITSTQIYTHTNASKLKGAVDKLAIE